MTQPKEIIVQIARPDDRYPHGLVEHGYFYAEKGHVYLCDERGVRTGTGKALRPRRERRSGCAALAER